MKLKKKVMLPIYECKRSCNIPLEGRSSNSFVKVCVLLLYLKSNFYCNVGIMEAINLRALFLCGTGTACFWRKQIIISYCARFMVSADGRLGAAAS